MLGTGHTHEQKNLPSTTAAATTMSKNTSACGTSSFAASIDSNAPSGQIEAMDSQPNDESAPVPPTLSTMAAHAARKTAPTATRRARGFFTGRSCSAASDGAASGAAAGASASGACPANAVSSGSAAMPFASTMVDPLPRGVTPLRPPRVERY